MQERPMWRWDSSLVLCDKRICIDTFTLIKMKVKLKQLSNFFISLSLTNIYFLDTTLIDNSYPPGDYYLRLLLEEDENESEEVSAIKKS